MITHSLQAIILAAGRSSRFGTETSKLSTTLCGQPMIVYPAKLCVSLKIPMTFIVGHQHEQIKDILISAAIPEVTFSLQSEPKGTGHALLCSKEHWHSEYLLVMNGDMPLVSKEIIVKLIEKQKETDAPIVTDFIALANNAGYKVETVSGSFDLLRGINTLKELWVAEHIKRSQLITHHMDSGVRFSMPQTVHLDLDVEIGSGSSIGAGVQLRSGTKIGKNCTIDAFTIIEKSTLLDGVTVLSNSLISDSVIEEEAQVGPFAHVRNQSTLGKKAVIGNFVEVNKSTIGASSKAKHLSYLGQAAIGEKVNIGAGTITCNYNGVSKHVTTILDGAHIGSNNCLVAPVTIGKNSMTAAGSVITKDVPEDALAIDYVPKLKEKFIAHKK